MKKKLMLCIGLVSLCVIIVPVISVIIRKEPTFNGSRVRNPDCYTLDFDIMNQMDSHSIVLSRGAIMSVDFAIEKGEVDLTIGIDGEEPIYRGNGINEGAFDLGIPADGCYRITVDAKHAKGYIYIYGR